MRLAPLLASRLSVVDSLGLVHKLSQYDARADAAELELSPDLRRLGVMICTPRASHKLHRLARIV